MYTGLSVDAVTGTEAAVFEGQSGIEAGLADELINASDAISVMATALNTHDTGGTMPQLTATEAAVQENQRVMGILTCQEAKGREQLATMLAGQQGMKKRRTGPGDSGPAAPQQPVASTQSEADRMMACEEAKGRGTTGGNAGGDAGDDGGKSPPCPGCFTAGGCRTLTPVIRLWHLDEAKGLRCRLNSWLPARE